MKKGLIFSLIISFISFLGLSIFAFLPKTNFSIDKIEEFNKFESSLILELQNDDYTYTEIDKNITLSELKQKVEPNSKNNQATIFNLEDNKILTTNEITNYCEENDLLLEKTETGYQAINKYALKRLVIFGALPNIHNANKVISYDDMHILCYNSIEETKSDCLNLTKNNIDVVVDFIMSATSDNSVSAQSTFNNWSEVAVDLTAYTDYRTDKEAVVVVLDTGINTLHPVFENRLLKENGKIVGLSYESSSYTYNKNNIQLTDSLSFEDDNGHGSHVAGIIASQTPTNVKILPVRVLNKEGKGDFTKIVAALKKVDEIYTDKYNIVCTNLSLGGTPGSDYFSTGLNDFNNIFNKLKAKNILSVVAAGNDNKDASVCLPAACGDSAIVVSALTSNSSTYTGTNNLIFANTYSNYGSTVDISAPGTSITSAWKASRNSSSACNTTELKQGTSQATPHVSACVAKLCLDNDFYTTSTPNYTASQIENILYTSSLDLGSSGKDIYFGYGALRYTNINAKTEPTQTINYTASNKTFTYDGNYHNISINVTNPTIGYTIKYSLEDYGIYDITNINSIAQFKNANNGITIYYQISAPGYITVTGSKTLTINKRELTYNVQNQTSTYGNTSHVNQTRYTKTSGSIVTGDNLGITLATTANRYSNVGTYNINLNYTNSNYSITSNTATLTINPKAATINVNNKTLTYGENFTLSQLSYSTSGLVNGDSIANITLSTDAAEGINPAGSYTINATYSPNNNYTISVSSGTLTINKRILTYNLEDQISTYGKATHLDQSKYTQTSGLVVSDDDLGITLTTTANRYSNVGTYNINLNYTNSNYSITSNTATLTINKKSVTINLQDQTSAYGDAINLDQTKYTIPGLVPGDIIENIVLSTIAVNNSINNYDITATYTPNSNYSISVNKGTYSVTKRIITIEITNEQIKNQTIEYGDELSLDNSSYKIKSGTILAKDRTTFQVTLSSQNNTAGAICNNKNYDINIDNNQIKIIPRKLSITINNQYFNYGDEIILNHLNYSITEGSFARNNHIDDEASVKLSTDVTPTSNVNGEYEIDIKFNNMDKYDLTIIKGKAIINPRNITISTQQSKTYGEENNLDNSLYTIESGHILAGTDLQLHFTTTANKLSPVGDYEITLLSCNPNYNIIVVNSYLTINPRLIEIYVFDQEGTYGTPIKLDHSQYSVDMFNLVEGSNLEIVLSTDADLTSSAGSSSVSSSPTKSVGNYNIYAETLNTNYILDVQEGIFTINKRKISIRLYDQSVPHTFNLTYNKDDYDIMSGSIVGNDELNIELFTNATAMSFAGDYKILATYLNENYDVTFTTATLTLEFSYVDALIILTPIVIVILIATLILVVFVKRKNKSIPLYKKWTK